MILTLHTRNTANNVSVANISTFSKEANFITVLRFLTPAGPYLIPCEHRHQMAMGKRISPKGEIAALRLRRWNFWKLTGRLDQTLPAAAFNSDLPAP
jgi:hypothetical protein